MKKKNFLTPDPTSFFAQMIWKWSDALDRSATKSKVKSAKILAVW